MNARDMFTYGAIAAVAIIALMGLGRSEPVNTVVERVIEKQQELGAANSPAVIDGCVEIEGVVKCYRSARLNTASTTQCSFRMTATSTVVATTVRVDSSSTSAQTLQVGYGTHSNATTTRVGTNVAIAANAAGSLIGSTTPALAPNTFFNVAATGGTGTFSNSGECQLEYIQL
jgi:hypothetical protein